MHPKVIVLLGMAVLCAIGAMFGVRQLLKQPNGPQIKMQKILVAKQEIRVEETVTAEMIVAKEIPADLVPEDALDDHELVLGRWSKVKILAGDVITDAKLAEKGTPTGLLARITPGKRAASIRVDERSGVSGFILPGYHVDIIQNRPSEEGGAIVLLEDVLVLASGGAIDSPEESRSIEARTVTVEVTPEEAQVLSTAINRGNLTLTLRGFDDHERLLEFEERQDSALTLDDPATTDDSAPSKEPEAPPSLDRVILPQLLTPRPESVVAASQTTAARPPRFMVFSGRNPPKTTELATAIAASNRQPESRSNHDLINKIPEEFLQERRPFRLDQEVEQRELWPRTSQSRETKNDS